MARRFIVPTFVLFDYSFRPDSVTRGGAWRGRRPVASDPQMKIYWRRIPMRPVTMVRRSSRATEARLDRLPADSRTILVNHFPLRQDLAVLPRIPRFSIWCGTTQTNEWHRRYRVDVAVYGHLHMRSTHTIDGTRFEEVSLGYPRQWTQSRGLNITCDAFVKPNRPGRDTRTQTNAEFAD